MIRALRRKFIMIASGCILLILSVVLLCINVLSYYSGYRDSMSILSYIASNNGKMPEENPDSNDVDFFVSRELRFETRYFSVITDTAGNLIGTNNEHIHAVTAEEAEAMYTQVFAGSKTKGSLKLSDSYFLYLVKELSGKELNETLFSENDLPAFLNNDTRYKLILFMDCTNRFYRIRSMRTISLLIGAGCFVVFVLLVSIFSGLAVKPVAENYEKQKQFITNAGHELKTPLTIISANAEVIEAIDGESEWTQSIRHQVDRLAGLVGDLVTIARLDESAERNDTVMKPFAISAAFQALSEDFRTVAVQQGKSLEADIQPEITVNGSEKPLRELLSILLDNAVKYCDAGGRVCAGLKAQKHRVILTVSNTYAESTDCSRFFDRFYRADTSHNSEVSGYGIGLSMAETIVRLHKGKISAQQTDGRVIMTVILKEAEREDTHH